MPYFSYTQFQLGSITIYIWGFLVGLAFIVGYWLALKEAERKGIDQNKIFWLAILIFAASISMARLGYFLQFGTNGLMFYGGLFGTLIISWFYIRKNKLNFLKIADTLMPSVALGLFIGRIGCFLIKDHPGTITNLPWAIQWPDGILRHPVALYLLINGLIMFLVFWFLRNRLQKHGQLFIIFLIWYSTVRFLLESTRIGELQYFGLFTNQWISIFVFVYGIILLCKMYGIVFQLKKHFRN